MKAQDFTAFLNKLQDRNFKIPSQKGVIKYFTTMWKLPWIWIWVYYLCGSGIVLWSMFTTNTIVIEQTRVSIQESYSIEYLWTFVTFSLILNYTIAFVYRFVYIRLGTIMFLISLLIELIFFIHLWPYIALILRGA